MKDNLNKCNGYILSADDKHGQLFLNQIIAIAIADAETTKFLDVNDAWINLYGYTAAEALTMKAFDVSFEAEDSAALFKNIKIGESVHVPLRYHHKKDGSIFPVEVFANCYHLNGRSTICAMIRDISARIQAEENLNKSEKLFRALIENSPVLIQILNVDGTIAYSSPTIKEILGYDEGEMLNQSFIKFLDPEDAVSFMKEFNNLIIAGDAKKSCEVRFFKKNSERRYIEVRMANMINEPSVKGIIINAIDITNQKTIENELKKTASVAEEAKAAANSANKAKSQFLANISHEIRTPLNSILGFSEMMKKTPLLGEQKELVDYITFSGKCLYTLIDDVLDFSKIEAGKIDIEKIEFDLEKSVNDTISMLKAQAAEKNIYISHLNGYKSDRFLSGDPKRLSQVLLNLLSNAVKFSENGKVIVKTEIVKETAQRVDIEFNVMDEGIGISPEKLKTIFAPFMQSDGSVTRRYGGTGLGLTIANQLVKLMGGGGIGVESTQNLGSRFYFTIGFARGGQLKKAGGGEQNAPVIADKNKYDILLVEDNYMNIILIKKIVRLAGHRVQVAENGLEAIKLLETGRYDIVLLDLQMPVMDGFETAEKIRAMGLEIPVIAVTASATREDLELCKQIGMNGFLSKPIDINELDRVIEKVIKANEFAVSDRVKIKDDKAAAGDLLAFNKKTLFENMSGIDELIKDSLELFMKYSPQNIENIQSALNANDAQKLKFYSHSLKSTARGVGAETIADVLYRLEKSAVHGKIDGSAAELTASLCVEYDKFIAELKKEGLF
ncbi:MAG: Sensory/regulatory protein RpfC [bacterium ADurb.Bin243]|nr:MAG: Sensory/regulatory protein RpfC [bacterium ADurb.Bin243]HOD38929.1 PAS domain S-box protein [Candidatus Wallbacteria bacterium]